MLTPETLTRHELVGLPVRVVDAANPDLVGTSGRVVRETTRTLVIRSETRDRQVPKRGTTFAFRLDAEPTTHPTDDDASAVDGCAGDEAASVAKDAGDAPKREQETAGVRPGQSCWTASGSSPATQAAGEDCEGALYVTVDGTRLLSRPALRTETAGETTWQSD